MVLNSLTSDGEDILYDVEFTIMTSDSGGTSDWHHIPISKSNISVTSEIDVIIIDVIATICIINEFAKKN